LFWVEPPIEPKTQEKYPKLTQLPQLNETYTWTDIAK
jgi:hypothetical protein